MSYNKTRQNETIIYIISNFASILNDTIIVAVRLQSTYDKNMEFNFIKANSLKSGDAKLRV
ncbi:hypothetical protein acsn021_37800 [Anaerocolumna cellulosilytica]|uniref:Uncharacterized protein n=1 Tax=Anaerocolumna cellulosilytica TaxID=433286 RepID=A0A6S6RBP7_9FIRM|nr:hypothetical protein acsn021_37800 [Anaerocolumna cellulosilytica]